MSRNQHFAGLALGDIPFITGTLTDNAHVGTLVACCARSMNALANTDTTLSHVLGRVPNGYLLMRTKSGGVLYDGSLNGSDWTASSIVLRSTVAGDVVTFLLW